MPRAKDGRKVCSKCREDQPATSEFYPGNKGCLDGFDSVCRKCIRLLSKAWRARNLERVADNAKRWYAANKEQQLAYRQQWRDENRERFRQTQKAWALKNSDRVLHHQRLRQIREQTAPGGPFNNRRADYRERVALYGGWCAYCETRRMEVLDHAKPLSRGGSNHACNVYPACHHCNNQKNKKILWKEWCPPKARRKTSPESWDPSKPPSSPK